MTVIEKEDQYIDFLIIRAASDYFFKKDAPYNRREDRKQYPRVMYKSSTIHSVWSAECIVESLSKEFDVDMDVRCTHSSSPYFLSSRDAADFSSSRPFFFFKPIKHSIQLMLTLESDKRVSALVFF